MRLAIYDVLGRRVAVLVNGPIEAGRHQALFEASHLPSGVYIARMEAGTQIFTRRLLLLK